MHIGRHTYKTSNFTPGRCGVTVERISLGHERLCGQVESAPTHEQYQKSQKIVTVCAHCLTESCCRLRSEGRRSILICTNKTAGTVTDTEENIARMVAPEEHQPTKEELEYEERDYMDRTYMTEAERLGQR